MDWKPFRLSFKIKFHVWGYLHTELKPIKTCKKQHLKCIGTHHSLLKISYLCKKKFGDVLSGTMWWGIHAPAFGAYVEPHFKKF